MNRHGCCSSDFKYGEVHDPSSFLSRHRESRFNHACRNSTLESDGVSMQMQCRSPDVCRKCVMQDDYGRGSKPLSHLPLQAESSLVQQLSLYPYETSGPDTRILDKYIFIKQTELVSFGGG